MSKMNFWFMMTACILIIVSNIVGAVWKALDGGWWYVAVCLLGASICLATTVNYYKHFSKKLQKSRTE